MGLAQVHVSVPYFQQLYTHLTTHKPRYRNMHLRATRIRNGHREMRHLHAVYASGATEIAGMISGPAVFCHYELTLVRGQPQMRVLAEDCNTQEADRIQHRFLRDMLRRMRDEQENDQDHPVRRLAGQFYLRRCRPGMLPDHANCEAATSSGALDPRFVAQFHHWNFELLRPPPRR
jgi:hypothetical protein